MTETAAETRTIRLTPASAIDWQTAFAERQRRTTWGEWHLDPTVYVLYTEAGGYRYEVDLERCLTSAEVLDWICQIAGKIWDEPIVGDLVQAIDDVLRPQANLCSFGASKRLTKKTVRAAHADSEARS